MRLTILILLLSTFLFTQNSRPEYVLQDSERIIRSGGQAVRWGNQYTWILEGDLIIEKGAKLIIDAGTTIKFRPNMDKGSTGKDPNKCELIVRGELIAIGKPSQNQRITFTSAAPQGQERAGDWYGIIVYRNNKLTRIQNADIYYGHRGISCFGSSPIIQNSQILYSYNTGIYLTAKSKAQIQSNMINSNSYAGIEVVMRSTPKISENTIQSNEYGIMIYDSSEPNIGSTDSENSNVGQNNISGNFTYDLYNHSIKSIKAENNSWSSTNITDIQKTIFDRRTHSSYGLVDIEPISSTTQAEFQRQALQNQNILASATTNRSTTRSSRNASRTTTRPATTTSRPTTTNRSTANQTTTNNTTRNTNNLASNNNTTRNTTTPATTQQSTTQSNNTATNTQNSTTSSSNTTTPITKNNTTVANNTQTQQSTTNTNTTDNNTTTTEPEEPKTNYTLISQTTPYLSNFLDPGTGIETIKASPEYKGSAKAQGIRGRVILKITVDTEGNVETAQVLRSAHSLLEEPSIEAAKKYKFSQPTIESQPVRFTKTLIFNF